ncbi:MAG: hypothetical protein ABEK00_00595 [Candidatus Nanohaloarchaea archaeon]
MPEDLHIRLPDEIHQNLESVTESTGLSKSEITRRGIIEQIGQLGGKNNV